MDDNIFENKSGMNKIAALVDEFSSSSLILDQKKQYLYNLRNSGSKLTFVTGLQGVGKSVLIDLFLKVESEKKAIVFDCYENVCLDDIIFFFYRILFEKRLLDKKNLRKDETFAKESIDQKIISSINNLNETVTIVFDSFEKLYENEKEEIDPDILNFIEYLIKNKNTSLIISSRIMPDELVDKYHGVADLIEIEPLSKSDIITLVQSRDLNVTKSVIEKFYEETRGLPLYVKSFFLMMMDFKKDDIFDSLVEMNKSGKSFENYVFSKRYEKLDDKETFNKLCLIRHPSDREFLYELISKIDLAFLLNKNLITSFRGGFYVKDYIKNIVLPMCPPKNKSKYHQELADIYAKQIPLKHSQRLIKLSRTSLHDECSYHQNMVKDISVKHPMSNIDFIASTLKDDAILLMGKETSAKKPEIKEPEHYEEREPKPVKKAEPVEKKVLKDEFDEDIKVTLNKEDFDIQGVSLKLSEEEQKLLSMSDEEDETEFPARQVINLSELENFRSRTDYEDIDFDENEEYQEEDDYLEKAIRAEESGDFHEALDYYKKYHYEIRGTDKEIYALDKISLCFTRVGNKEEAVNALERAYLICFGKNEFSKAGQIILSIAKVYKEFKDYERAQKSYEKFFNQELSWIEPKYVAEAYKDLGDIFNQENNFRQALLNYNQAMTTLEDYEDPSEVRSLLSELYFKIGLMYDDAGDITKAVNNYKHSEKLDSNPDTNYYIADCYSNLGLIYREKGDFKTAINYLNKTYQVDQKRNNLEGIYYSSLKLADAYCDVKDYQNAIKYYSAKLNVAREIKSVYYISSTYLDLGDVNVELNDFSKAVRYYILAQRVLGDAISTDSQYRIQRRVNSVKRKIGLRSFENILKEIRNG